MCFRPISTILGINSLISAAKQQTNSKAEKLCAKGI